MKDVDNVCPLLSADEEEDNDNTLIRMIFEFMGFRLQDSCEREKVRFKLELINGCNKVIFSKIPNISFSLFSAFIV